MQITGRELNLIYDLNKEECTYAFKNIDICLNAHETVGIMGPSGCGKSSLLYVLSGMRKPTGGTVYYDDMDIDYYTLNEKANIRRSKFGLIFQKHFLIEYLSVLENVLTSINSRKKEDIEKAMNILETLKISHLADRRPGQISCGQRQRAAIARALMNNPEVIFADEPTASLDHNNAMEVIHILDKFKEKATIVIATHDRTILKNTDRIIELWDGCAVK
ncbi:ABC transporter ATP-binding protein [Anaerocolumna sp. MB42-C2]|uniref:ABC transporter ATP-binding protein n=1 Tax=Anaerocolumna sp. MB42-C2 TaxID=3070997 RepID=UPI0027E17B60|nr:ATP-binding cassette domain-containing protein [Anaerocolumna sp. MB42-C2]WMJ86014.1 ATP-binding cassette domain-containing protein [Anaerocolumna sp. MB42-C2]